MNRTIDTLTSGALAALARLDSVAQNLANANTTGYKAERVIFRVQPIETSTPGAAEDARGTAAQVTQLATLRDFSQGPVRPSGNPLDVALAGSGFFVVATPQGERYTRAGNFALDREGFLVTQGGQRVQGDGGDLQPGEGALAIAADGTVTRDGQPAGRIKVVDFGDTPALVPQGSSLFAPAPGVVPTPVDAAAVRLETASIEGSNTDPVAGLLELIEVSRGFDSYMKAMQRLDEIAQRSITDVGRVG